MILVLSDSLWGGMPALSQTVEGGDNGKKALLAKKDPAVPVVDIGLAAGGRLHEYLGSCDFYGKASYWLDTRINIPFASSDKHGQWLTPHYSSQQRRIGKSMLGHGWWLPILESNVMQVSEAWVFAHFPDGALLGLHNSSEGKYRTQDRQWTGEQRQGGKSNQFVLRHASGGLELFFEDGLLRRLRKNEDTYQWLRGPQAITLKKNDDTLIEARLDPETKLAKLLEIKHGQHKGIGMEFEFQPVPLRNPDGVILDMRPALSKLADNASNIWSIEQAYDEDAKTTATSIRAKYQNGNERELETLIVDAAGRLLEDKESIYTLDMGKDGKGVNGGQLVGASRRFKEDGKIEAYKYDPSNGIAVTEFPDGRRLERQYILSEGPAFGKTRTHKLGHPDGALTETKNFYDDAGVMIRQIKNNK